MTRAEKPKTKRPARVFSAVSHARVRALFTYEARSGLLLRKVRTSKKALLGSPVGGTPRGVYRYAAVDGCEVPLHHLVWFYHHGEWPSKVLSFKNEDPGDTRIENLYPRSMQEAAVRGSKLKTLWRRVRQWSKGTHTWRLAEQLFAEVGVQPSQHHVLVPIDSEQLLGPGNWQWRKKNPGERINPVVHLSEKQKADKQLRRKFGIGTDDYQRLLAEQEGVCAICSRPETAFRMGKLLPLSVDHDHTTLTVRGLLCTACNIGIGSLQDNPDILRRAISYLQKYQHNTKPKIAGNVVRFVSKQS